MLWVLIVFDVVTVIYGQNGSRQVGSLPVRANKYTGFAGEKADGRSFLKLRLPG